jgi:hypothetical protein
MATRYKAKVGSKHPDLDMLDTIYDENEQTHTKYGAAVAKEAARGALDFYRLKAAPSADLRAAVVHALGSKLAAKVFGQSYKAQSGPLQRLIMALEAIGDRMPPEAFQQLLEPMQRAVDQANDDLARGIAEVSRNVATGKEARGPNATSSLDALLSGAAASQQRTSLATEVQRQAVNPYHDPFRK